MLDDAREEEFAMVTQPRGGRASMIALALSTAAFTICFYAWTLYGPLSPILQKVLDLSELQVGWLVAIPVVLGSLMRIPLGFLSQRFGGRVIFIGLMLLLVMPLVAIAAWHTSYIALLFFGFVLGFAGASFAVGVPYVNDWYSPERRGFALGIYGMGTGGTVIAGLTAPLLAGSYGIGAPFIFAALLVAAITAVFALYGRNAPGFVPASGGVLEAFDVFRTNFRAWALTLTYFVTFGGFVAMFLYLPRILVGVYDLSKPDAGARAAGFALVAVLARPIGGALSDRYGAERVLVYSLTWAAAAGALLSATYTWMIPFTFCCLTLAAAFGAGSGAVFKIVGTEFSQSVGAVTGVVGAAGGLGGFFPPIVMGVVKTLTGTYSLGFALLGAVSAITLALIFVSQPQTSASAQRRRA
jgi:MFS transporter, NNP family, nitrate/nitrite transporter